MSATDGIVIAPRSPFATLDPTDDAEWIVQADELISAVRELLPPPA